MLPLHPVCRGTTRSLSASLPERGFWPKEDQGGGWLNSSLYAGLDTSFFGHFSVPDWALTSAEHCTAPCPSCFCPKRHGVVRAHLQTPFHHLYSCFSSHMGDEMPHVSSGEAEGNGKRLPSIPCLANPAAFPGSGVFRYRLWAPAFSAHRPAWKFPVVIFPSAFEFKLHLEDTAKLLLLLVTQL